MANCIVGRIPILESHVLIKPVVDDSNNNNPLYCGYDLKPIPSRRVIAFSNYILLIDNVTTSYLTKRPGDESTHEIT